MNQRQSVCERLYVWKRKAVCEREGALRTDGDGEILSPHACQSFSKLKIDGAHRQHG